MKKFTGLFCLSLIICLCANRVVAQVCNDGIQQWNATKSSFRFGKFTGSLNSPDSMGCYSFSFGTNTKAMGSNSFAGGSGSSAIGTNTFSFGYSSTATGIYSMAMGTGNQAIGVQSVAIGAYGHTQGQGSVAIGYDGYANAYYSMVIGTQNAANGYFSTAMGVETIAKSYNDFVIGSYNDTNNLGSSTATDPLNRIFQVGNGDGFYGRSNAMTVLRNGNVGIGILNPAQKLEVAGNITVQNGKGIVRNTDAVQKKVQTNTITVNATLSPGATTTITFSFPETFSNTPDIYVGNVTGGSGYAEVINTAWCVSGTSGRLLVHNPGSVSRSPNYTIKVISIGPQ